jgi:hypothetical protein
MGGRGAWQKALQFVNLETCFCDASKNCQSSSHRWGHPGNLAVDELPQTLLIVQLFVSQD